MPLRRSGNLRHSHLKKFGPTSKKWKEFRDEQFEKDKDEEGLIRCQDFHIGLRACGISRSKMDLHHTEGRDGKLLFDRSKMVWLIRECHYAAHGS